MAVPLPPLGCALGTTSSESDDSCFLGFLGSGTGDVLPEGGPDGGPSDPLAKTPPFLWEDSASGFHSLGCLDTRFSTT